MRPVLYIAGDIHYAGGEHPCLAWLDRLAQGPPARLVLLGDIVDWWIDGEGCRRRYAPLLARLKALARGGWRLDLLRGNRELAAGRAFEAACGARLAGPALALALGPRRLRIVHGDRLVADPGYRAWSALARSLPFQAWSRLHPPPLQEAVARALRRRSQGRQAARPPPRFDLSALRAALAGVDALVLGHIHAHWRRRLAGVECILVGDWSAGRGRWVEGMDDGTLVPRCAAW